MITKHTVLAGYGMMLPRNLNYWVPDTWAHLQALGFDYQEAERLYTSPEFPGCTLTCERLYFNFRFGIELTFTKPVLVDPLSGEMGAAVYVEKYLNERTVALVNDVLEKAGFSIETTLRRRRLRALIA